MRIWLGVEGGYVRATCGNGVGYAVVGREWGVAVVVVETGNWWDFNRGEQVEMEGGCR